MKKKFILGYCYLTETETILPHLTTVTLTSDAVTQHQYDFSASKDGCVDQV